MKQGASTRVGPAPPGRRKEHALAATVLMLLLNVMFFPYVWGDLDLMTGANDSPSVTSLGGPNGDPHHPVNQMHWKMLDANGSGTLDEPTFPLVHHEIFHDGDVPLWNPDAAFGTPLAAAMQQQPFYPLTAVVMLAPGPSNFAFYIILRLFVAGFATYLFLRFFIGFLPALGGAIAFMLNGYFIKYLTMPHLSVETLTGALFLGVEYVLLRRRPWFAVPFLAVVVWFDFLGGMPESSFINIVFATMYAAFRIATVRAYRTGWLARCREIVLALGCGFACAAFLILPFAELVVQSFNIHEPSKNGGNFAALVADTSPRTSLAIYALPMLFGPPWEAVGLALNDGYFGVVIIFCGIAAVAYAALVPKSGLAVPVIFFATAVGLLTAKRYGLPWINWVGALPIVRVIALTKYQEAATAFAVAALVGFGLHALVGDARRRPAIAATAFALTLAVLQKSYDVTAHLTSPAQIHARAYFYLAFASGLLALVAVGALAALAARGPSARDRILGGCALLALCVEMSLNYFVPMYYFVDPGPSKRQNPYLGAPYIDFVHANTTDGARVYAEKKAWLEPDWPQAFDLKDIRNIDAIYVDRYLPFCRAFIPKENKTDLLEEFSGAGDYTMASPAGRKLLSLGSVRYVVAGDMLDPSTLGARIQAYVAAHEAGSDRSPSGQFRLGSEWLDGFAQARAAQDVTMPLDVAPGAQFIALALGTPDDFATHAGRSVDFFRTGRRRARPDAGRFAAPYSKRAHTSRLGAPRDRPAPLRRHARPPNVRRTHERPGARYARILGCDSRGARGARARSLRTRAPLRRHQRLRVRAPSPARRALRARNGRGRSKVARCADAAGLRRDAKCDRGPRKRPAEPCARHLGAVARAARTGPPRDPTNLHGHTRRLRDGRSEADVALPFGYVLSGLESVRR